MKLLVNPGNPTLRQVAHDVATDYATDVRALHLRLLLHLPRLASERGTVALEQVMYEAARLAKQLPSAAAWELRSRPSLGDLKLSVVEGKVARRICENFHYLGSYRSEARPYALETPCGEVVALAVTTGCDVDRLRSISLEHLSDSDPRVLARVFALKGAPKNTLTRLFKLVCLAERADGCKSVVTYVNPNLGFTGASYRAGNWLLLGDEPGTTYRYVHGKYLPDRVLSAMLNKPEVDDVLLTKLLGIEYQKSRMRLEPLLVFGRAL